MSSHRNANMASARAESILITAPAIAYRNQHSFCFTRRATSVWPARRRHRADQGVQRLKGTPVESLLHVGDQELSSVKATVSRPGRITRDSADDDAASPVGIGQGRTQSGMAGLATAPAAPVAFATWRRAATSVRAQHFDQDRDRWAARDRSTATNATAASRRTFASGIDPASFAGRRQRLGVRAAGGQRRCRTGPGRDPSTFEQKADQGRDRLSRSAVRQRSPPSRRSADVTLLILTAL